MAIPEKRIGGSGKAVSTRRDLNPGTEDSVRKDLTHRLEVSAKTLSRVDFEALVVRMAREQLRVNQPPIVGSTRVEGRRTDARRASA